MSILRGRDTLGRADHLLIQHAGQPVDRCLP